MHAYVRDIAAYMAHEAAQLQPCDNVDHPRACSKGSSSGKNGLRGAMKLARNFAACSEIEGPPSVPPLLCSRSVLVVSFGTSRCWQHTTG
eukprot:CAMPEP_0115710954 /NCGR_PEP_ID=MMETSP0272-20121206/73303_1 /TAXON_ID=71861 /ORGANISM="Scrippsiella trochoidea, Strain CCMP3099" /LENGTH=89 /DNA_ID=CAMNT_0003152711 /DNA_START=223 /DNA_END=489 /DNA_ORIENTATION=+